MTNRRISQNHSQDSDPPSKGISGDDKTLSQEQQTLLDRLPQSLIEWLARINQRYLALNQDKTNDAN